MLILLALTRAREAGAVPPAPALSYLTLSGDRLTLGGNALGMPNA